MSYREGLARRAVREALRLRARHGLAPDQPVCPVDLALEEGLEVRFEPAPSLEGLYAPDEGLIVLGSLRPSGRRNYTCAHELGHHVFGHGFRVDEMADVALSEATDDEYLANRFAAALLMPKLAVLRAFGARGWDPTEAAPDRVYAVSCALGVGYATLVSYLEGTLGLVSSSAASRMRKRSPKAIRAQLVGADTAGGLVVVDKFWRGRPVDAEVGDVLLVPPGAKPDAGIVERAGLDAFRAFAPGVTRLSNGEWEAELRVMRRGFRGLAQYRHLEDPDGGD